MDPHVLPIPLLGIMLPIILVPIILGIRHAKIARELEHAERMKALELGRPFPMDHPFWNAARVAVILVTVVPLGSFALAWLASVSEGVGLVAWPSAGLVGLVGILSGTWMAQRHFIGPASDPYAKAPIEDDAYDVVSARH